LEEQPMPTYLTSFLDRVEVDPDSPALVFLADGETDEHVMTGTDLDRAARGIASELRARVDVGDPVVIMCEPGLDYVAAFLGCLYAGAVAVPAYPPTPAALERSTARLRAVIADCGARHAVTSQLLSSALQDDAIRSLVVDDTFTWTPIDVERGDGVEDGNFEVIHRPATAPVFLQYTSGSTANPKGVVVTSECLLANIEMIQKRFQVPADATVVSWLPPYHDMGLVGVILAGLVLGTRIVQMSPEAFLKRPLRWLYALDRYHAFISPAPNFAFELCARRASDADVEALDLSEWKVAINGAEPIDHRTLDAFLKRFGPTGFMESSIWPSYGLAEATLLQASGSFGVTAHRLQVDADALRQGRVERATGASGVSLITCGTATDGSRITIRDDDDAELHSGLIGEIVIEGDNVAPGYRGGVESEAFTHSARGTRTFKTGDLGALVDGELVVTGRSKDLIVIRGQNHYPQDIERTIELSDPRLRPGCSVALALSDAGGSDQLVVVAEVRNSADAGEELAERLRAVVNEEHGIRPRAVLLLDPRTLPKTSSGKVQRAPTSTALVRGELVPVYEWRSSELDIVSGRSQAQDK
jgi:polyketide synthase 12